MSRSILLGPDITGFVSVAKNDTSESGRRMTAEEAEKIRRDAVSECEKRFDAELSSVNARQGRLLSAIEESIGKFQTGIEQAINEQLIETAVRIAEIIIRSRLPDRDMIRDVIRETLEPLTDLQGVRIRMNPGDAKEVIALRESGETRNISDSVEIVGDTSLSCGDVLIESRNGYFNAQIADRLEVLKQRLKEHYRNAHSDNT